MRIDPHVHFRDEEQSYKETIAHGLKIAKEQGVQIVFDMPNTLKPVISEEDVKRRLSLVPKEFEDNYYTYVGVTKNPVQIEKAVKIVNENERVCGLKLFAGKSVGNLEILEKKEQEIVYSVLSDCGYNGVLAVHCEKEEFIKNFYDPNKPISHSIARPKIAEIESLKDQIELATKNDFKGNLHVCHASCKETIDLVNKAKKDLRITCGVTPHHIMWDNTIMNSDLGGIYKMNPPLRNPADVVSLRKCLFEGKIDWIETDHAPHAIGEKLSDNCPSGYPSLYVYKSFVDDYLPAIGLEKELIDKMTFDNIVSAFKLKL
jgi:dihydroorotase